MDVLDNLKLREWVNEFNDVSNRRIVAHELNNYLTPLAMHVSMLKSNLDSNQLGKAIERVAKLEKAMSKLKGFSQDLLIENISPDQIEYAQNSSEIKGIVEDVSQMPEFDGIEMKWEVDNFDAEINPKILTLFTYTYLREGILNARSDLCKVNVVKEANGMIKVILLSHSSQGSTSSALEIDSKPSSFERLIKIVNSSHSSHRISRQEGFPSSGILSVDPVMVG